MHALPGDLQIVFERTSGRLTFRLVVVSVCIGVVAVDLSLEQRQVRLVDGDVDPQFGSGPFDQRPI